MAFQRNIVAGCVLVLGVAAGASVQEAEAQTRLANGAQFGNWTVSCEAVGVNETICVLSQRLVAASGQSFLAEFLAFADPEAPGAYVAARVPLGVHFPAGFALRPEDGDEPIAFEWQSCSSDLCEALVRFDADALGAIDSSENMIAGYLPRIDGEALVFRVAMGGLLDGITALARATGAPDPSGAAAPQ